MSVLVIVLVAGIVATLFGLSLLYMFKRDEFFGSAFTAVGGLITLIYIVGLITLSVDTNSDTNFQNACTKQSGVAYYSLRTNEHECAVIRNGHIENTHVNY